ncbi:MAG: Rne/Rng family ribonuclease [Phycisphaerales bacterium]
MSPTNDPISQTSEATQGDSPAGELPTTDTPTSESSATDASTGEPPAGEDSAGERPKSSRRKSARKSKAASKRASKSAGTPESEPESEAEVASDTASETESQTRSEDEAEVASETESDAESPTRSEDEAEVASETATEAESETRSEARSKPASRSGGRRSAKGDRGGASKPAPTPAPAPVDPSTRVMVVNDTPGEECRIAILEKGRLDGLSSERLSTATNVGNIYKGRVTNVEPAIQAAFVDFGEGQNGFLHISDLHPRYFPGGDKTEKVGKKVPHRARPLIQDALKRGSEILVQVLKEGLGTKGPTLTSYISLPGRLLVMMPGMDKVGVSRKVEDEAQRKAMRKILDSLALPEGFGFILRTAGFSATKTDLTRDVAYLTRMWKVMEKRIAGSGAPCALYTESDLLLRTLRDVLDSSIGSVVVDSESALQRSSTFLSVIAPRSSPPVRYYDGKAPIFHAFDVERQIELIHAREVPLPSGGALVFDQAEALVAIDVNSGKSRSARDSETNAYRTNCEAVEEICRQLRLRDLGGLVVCDMIDMRAAKHRKDIKERFEAAFKKDRARTTVLPVSDFGIVEITRQRMRPSLRKAHFAECPTCAGHGEVRLPDSVAADALRRVGSVLAHERIRRVELVVPVRVASVLLSGRRRQLALLEREFGKRVDVRISEALGLDRVDLYAYDERNADVEIDRLPALPRPNVEALPTVAPPPSDTADEEEDDRGGRRGRRRRRRSGPADAAAIALAGGFEPDEIDDDETAESALAAAESAETDEDAGDEGGGGRRKRRRRRRRRGKGGTTETGAEADVAEVAETMPAKVSVPVVDEGPVRVHVLAKTYGVTSRDIVERCAAEGLDGVKAAMSSVGGETLATIRAWYEPVSTTTTETESTEADTASRATDAPSPGGAGDADESGEGGRKRRRRRRRRGKGGNSESETTDASSEATDASQPGEAAAVTDGEAESADVGEDGGEGGDDDDSKPRKRRRRRGGRRRSRSRDGESEGGDGSPADESSAADSGGGRGKEPGSDTDAPPTIETAADSTPKPRALYARGRTRKISPAAARADDR